MVIDAHQHFWDPERAEYPWMVGPAASLRRVYGPADLLPELRANRVRGTIAVQARSSIVETLELLALAANHPFVLGVVGWVDLTAANVAATIALMQQGVDGQRLVGVRHQVHDEADAAWLLRPEVQRGLEAVQEAGLAFDLLVRSRELPAAIQVARKFPGLRFVINHLAKPEIRRGIMEPWAGLMEMWQEEREHVWCKLSGMINLADHAAWRCEDLRPYILRALEVFGADRCMFGSDWPVLTLAGTYQRVLQALMVNIGHLDPKARQFILGQSAVEAYRLDPDRFSGAPPAGLA
jgi:L-fuconolactonase